MKQLEGKISIARSSGGDESKPIHISIEDSTSGCRLLDINLGLKEFAAALTGMSYMSCELEYYDTAPVGKTREVKEEEIFVAHNHTYAPSANREDVAEFYFKPYEVNGWSGRTSDLFNHHHWVKHVKDGIIVRVMFTRYVDPTPPALDSAPPVSEGTPA